GCVNALGAVARAWPARADLGAWRTPDGRSSMVVSRPTTDRTYLAIVVGTWMAAVRARAVEPLASLYRASPVRKLVSTWLAGAWKSRIRPSRATFVTVRPDASSSDFTAAMVEAAGPNRAAKLPGVRYWWNSGECLSVTCEMKRVSAASSRGCSTTAPETVAVGETAPSFVAPRGMSGFGASTRVPAGAAPAPEAEIAKHTSASNGAATSARTPKTFFM